MRSTALGTALALAGCATSPPAPDATVDLSGEWRVVAINGDATPHGASGYSFRFEPPNGFAQFGCNDASGPASVANGWLTAGNWIITAARCQEERMRFSRAYDMLSAPMAIERRGERQVVLRNSEGIVVLERLPPLALAGTKWRVISVNGHPPPSPAQASIGFTADQYTGSFGCNTIAGGYRIDGNRFVVWQSRMTERGCLLTTPSGPSLMDFELWGRDVLWGGSTIDRPAENQMRLRAGSGSIVLQRLP